MHTIAIVEAKAGFSALIARVEAGEEVAITRHGKVVARLVPDRPQMAAELFRSLPDVPESDLEAPEDLPPEPVAGLD
jgi:prevent-host-death family protein